MLGNSPESSKQIRHINQTIITTMTLIVIILIHYYEKHLTPQTLKIANLISNALNSACQEN
jgi:hypothetical protein